MKNITDKKKIVITFLSYPEARKKQLFIMIFSDFKLKMSKKKNQNLE